MPKLTIKNSNVKILPTDALLTFIKGNLNSIEESQEVFKSTSKCNKNMDFRKESCEKDNLIEELGASSSNVLTKNDVHLYINDFHYLKKTLSRLRQNKETSIYLYEFLEKCTVILPDNDFIPRNDKLDARCEKLKAAQANTAYMNITKNVNFDIKHRPEDTFAFQLKEVNRQVIAVVQFVFSVIAGFAFGFLGLELIFGNLDFGFRLLLGIMCALIIALAEIYFLAKKLNECEDVYLKKIN